jgi:hypothetical protein
MLCLSVCTCVLCGVFVTGQSFRHAYFNHVLAYKVSADVLAYICACMSKYWMYVASCVYLRLHICLVMLCMSVCTWGV